MSKQSLNNAITEYETRQAEFVPEDIRAYVKKFDKNRFQQEFKAFTDKAIADY
jgi:hypothetical protein